MVDIKLKKDKSPDDPKASVDHYSVKTICQLTGLNDHTLRAWERRYQVVHPNRHKNGRRVYSIEDLEKLKLVTLLVRKGFLIGNIATYDIHELSALVTDSISIPIEEETRHNRSHEFLEQLRATISGYELLKVHSLLQQARVEYGIRYFLLDIVVPFMKLLGEAVERGELSIGQEHAWSAIVRTELMQVFYLLTHSHALIRQHESPKIFAISTNEGNQHEFPALIAAVLCAFHGYPTYYFGANIPALALADAAKAVGSNCIILGLPLAESSNGKLDSYVAELQSHMPRVCQLWVGGVATDGIIKDKSIRKLHSLVDLDNLLTTIKKV